MKKIKKKKGKKKKKKKKKPVGEIDTSADLPDCGLIHIISLHQQLLLSKSVWV
jgi:hypothetical protein